MKDSITFLGSKQLKGLHISTQAIIYAAFYDPINFYFSIATVNFVASSISFSETLLISSTSTPEISRVIFLAD